MPRRTLPVAGEMQTELYYSTFKLWPQMYGALPQWRLSRNSCKEMVEVQCECANRKQMRTCAELAREFSRIATAQLASSMAEMQRGNYMELSEILAPVKLSGKSNKTLDCNEECRLPARNRRLAIGLQIRNPDLPSKLQNKIFRFYTYLC
ncbi:Protein shuttle craft [Eumeta japonica]|uniref:Protein shuttle craft n=1 Tax=Eumeta variegata TaxID=151549 RepID=A0A4C1S9D6_EUMVA|nr:Protein shuttle craft [Eumeta japonica]